MSGDRPRVLFVDHTAALGGAELCLLDTASHAGKGSAVVLFEEGPLVARLAEAAVDVVVVQAPGAVSRIRRDEAPRLMAASFGVVSLAWRLARHARKFDVLYANSQKAFAVAALAGVPARRPVVWHLHDLLSTEHFGRRQLRVAVGLARRFADAVVANSNATRDAYVAAGGKAGHVHVVYNGISPDPFDAVTDVDVKRVREELGVGGSRVIGLFGRLSPWKGQTVLLEAMVGLPDVTALLVGDALFEGDRLFAASLLEHAAALGVSDRVRALGFRDDVPTLMRACDVIVHASTSAEPFGRVIVEGMLAGRPVVASAAGGALELVEDGISGLMVAPGDPGALRDAIGRLLFEADLAARITAFAGPAARSRFAPEGVRRQIDRVLDVVTKRRLT